MMRFLVCLMFIACSGRSTPKTPDVPPPVADAGIASAECPCAPPDRFDCWTTEIGFRACRCIRATRGSCGWAITSDGQDYNGDEVQGGACCRNPEGEACCYQGAECMSTPAGSFCTMYAPR